MKYALAALALLALTGMAHADCDTSAIETALQAPLTGMSPKEIEVSDVSSTEGGIWSIYREADGRLNTIIRGDYGESGRQETRLSVVNRSTYGIASSRVDYLRHAFMEEAGPNGTAKRTTDYFYICDGKLLVPPAGAAMLDTDAYAKAGAEALALMRDHVDIKALTVGLKR